MQKVLRLKNLNNFFQLNFIDSYFNNTIKTVSGLRWCKENCIRSKFYLFVDDDFYVSVKNILAFLRNPVNYPEYLEEYKEQLRKLNRETKASGSGEAVKRNLLNLNMELPSDTKLFAGYVFNEAPHRRKN